ncbi:MULTISPECIES: extensin family protein [unclassified Paracoccus (in: a-proteobacteria)]|uniref:extensin-like domain-containing protein n=1 Tax=unclassified Paracoccus (in: a-proteobacteria) TaxID=2688777 RepID=UPI00049117C8|nr:MULTISPECIES: extensin family protein [unclassified Paracoccus (in: a-proteobacteria)]
MRGLLAGLTVLLTALPGQAPAEEAPVPRPGRPAEDRPAPRPDHEAAPAEPATTAEPAPRPQEPPAEDEQSERAGPPAPPIRATLRESDFAYSACLLELTLLGADFSEAPPILDPEQRDCGIDRPILLRQPLPGIEIPGGAPMRCDTARHLAHWLRDFVRPAAAMLPGQPRLVALEPGSTYQCRPTVGNAGETLSEHAFGNAFDIAAFRFEDGTRLAVEPRQDSGDLQEAFQRAVRGTACLHFTTVLGPGANAAHDNHLHLDIKARRGGFRLCQ